MNLKIMQKIIGKLGDVYFDQIKFLKMNYSNFKKSLYCIHCWLISLGFRIRLGKKSNQALFIIGVKGCVHILKICLQYIPSEQRVIVIANGMLNEEISWISKESKVYRIIKLSKQLIHSKVLDILFYTVKNYFAIIDYDCFVLNGRIWENLFSIDRQSQGNAYFQSFNSDLNLHIPFTFFLSFNSKVFKWLRRHYGVNSSQIKFSQLPKKAQKKLSEIKIDQIHLPEAKKNYFDTIKALQMLAIAEGYQVTFKRNYEKYRLGDDLIHIGGISYWNGKINEWTVRGAYFWHKALEIQPDK